MECIKFIPKKNLARLNYSFLFVFIGMCTYGLILPDEWESCFGLFAQPIVFAVKTVPSIEKFAEYSLFPEFFKGFVGLAVYVSPVHAMYILRWSQLDIRENGKTRLIVLERNHSVFFLVFSWFFLVICIYCLYVMPFPVPELISGHSFGARVGSGMLRYRSLFIFCGPLVTIGMSMFIAGSIIGVIRVFLKIRNRS